MSVLSLGDARKHLNITGFDHDDELQDVIDAAEAVLAHHVGPLEPTTVTEVVAGGTTILPLNTLPVISVTSVTSAAGAASTGLSTDLSDGLVTYTSGATFGSPGKYTVVYQAGRTTCPADLLLAVKELTRHLWESQRGAARPQGFDADEAPDPTAAYLLPYRVQELIAPHTNVAIGIA